MTYRRRARERALAASTSSPRCAGSSAAIRDQPRIGDSAARREEYRRSRPGPVPRFPGLEPQQGRARPAGPAAALFVKFLGLLGPQGALPLARPRRPITGRSTRDDAFPRFLDIFNHRFLQLFFRAWADARPIAQHDRPEDDRFAAYVGSFDRHRLGALPRPRHGAGHRKLAFAGLIGAAGEVAPRGCESLISRPVRRRGRDRASSSARWLTFEPGERTPLGQQRSALGVDTLLGASVFSVQDKIRIRIYRDETWREYRSFLPTGERCEPLADAVFFYLGDQLDWDVELALPARRGRADRGSAASGSSAGRAGWRRTGRRRPDACRATRASILARAQRHKRSGIAAAS